MSNNIVKDVACYAKFYHSVLRLPWFKDRRQIGYENSWVAEIDRRRITRHKFRIEATGCSLILVQEAALLTFVIFCLYNLFFNEGDGR